MIILRSFSCLAIFLAASCNTPSVGFMGLEATRVEVDGSVFEVRIRGEMAEAIRTNFEYAPRFGPIRARGAKAMALVSGCKVLDVQGDQALMTGKLDCG